MAGQRALSQLQRPSVWERMKWYYGGGSVGESRVKRKWEGGLVDKEEDNWSILREYGIDIQGNGEEYV